MSSSICSNKKPGSTLDERALLNQLCIDLLPKNGESDVSSVSGVSDVTLSSSASDVTLRSSSTVVSQSTTNDGRKDLVLKWSTKEQLITILNEYSAILYGQAPQNEPQILEKTNKLLRMLSGLPMRVKETIKETWEKLGQLNIGSTTGQMTENSFSSSGNCEFCNRSLSQSNLQAKNCNKCNRVTYCGDECENEDRSFHLGNCKSEPAAESNCVESVSSAEDESKAAGDLLLDLKWKARTKIIETLTMNQSYAIHNSRFISAEIKKNLIRKNKVLIQMLIGLSPRLVDCQRIGYLFPEEEEENENETEQSELSENDTIYSASSISDESSELTIREPENLVSKTNSGLKKYP